MKIVFLLQRQRTGIFIEEEEINIRLLTGVAGFIIKLMCEPINGKFVAIIYIGFPDNTGEVNNEVNDKQYIQKEPQTFQRFPRFPEINKKDHK